MSDGYIRLIPTDLHWQPTAEAAAAAVAYVARLFSGPGDAVEHVDHEFYDQVTLIDAGKTPPGSPARAATRTSIQSDSTT